MKLLLLLSLSLSVHQAVQSQQCENSTRYFDRDSERCCTKCQPGSRVTRVCDALTDTECELCVQGTYTERWNTERECYLCKGHCGGGGELTEVQACTPHTRRVCLCKRGSFCREAFDEVTYTCHNCVTVSVCPPGWGVHTPGGNDTDTKCEKCARHTYSNQSSATDICYPHTNCSELGSRIKERGNELRDTECEMDGVSVSKQKGEKGPNNVYVAVVCVIVGISLVSLSLLLCAHRRKVTVPFKTVFRNCVRDMENQTGRRFLRRESEPVTPRETETQTQTETETETVTPGRRHTPLEFRPVSGGSVKSLSLKTDNKMAPIIGSVYIYNPHSVYLGAVNPVRSSVRRLSVREKNFLEGFLRYPEQERETQRETQRETERERFPQQETVCEGRECV